MLYHFDFLTDGTVWTAGLGLHYVLGHHGNQDIPVFHPVDGLPPAQAIAVGYLTNLVLTRDGKVFHFNLVVEVVVVVILFPIEYNNTIQLAWVT